MSNGGDMTDTVVETPAVDWLRARIDETDTVLATVEANSSTFDTALRSGARECFEEAAAVRVELGKALQKTFDRNRMAFPGLGETLEPMWSEIEKSVNEWSDICSTQEELAEAQLNSLTTDWDQLLDEYRISVSDPMLRTRDQVIDHMKETERQMTRFQLMLASVEEAQWSFLNQVMVQSRKLVDAASLHYRSLSRG